MSTKSRRIAGASFAGLIAGFLGYALAGVSGVWVSPNKYERLNGLTRDEKSYRLQPSLSNLQLTEHGDDSNGDGRLDIWAVYANPGQSTGLKYIISDIDFDGKPDSVVVHIGDDNDHTSFVTSDKNNDLVVDTSFFILQSVKDASSYCIYGDLNLDGTIDTISQFKDNVIFESYIVTDFKLFTAKIIDIGNRLVAVHTDSDEWLTLKMLDNGNWEPCDWLAELPMFLL